jgi:hypothetical protein
MSLLLPCPFCGSTNLRYEFAGSQGYICCNECCTEGPCDERAADPYCESEAAVAAWNRRHDLAQPEPQGPTEMEIIAFWSEHCAGDGDAGILRLARFGCPAIEPVPVSERLPEPGTKVLAHYFNSHGKSRTVCARWIPAKFETADSDAYDDDFLEYDEESDTFYWPEAWYEAIENWDDYGSVKINEGEVTHWQPLPHWALPVPQQEVE